MPPAARLRGLCLGGLFALRGASPAADGCESAACCAAALIEASRAAVKIQFEVRMTLFSKFL